MLVGPLLVLSVYMPHGGYDEELVITITEEGKALVTEDFLILNIELKLETDGAGLDFQGLNSLDWYGPRIRMPRRWECLEDV